ncbi:MAG: acetate--CoA ligase [Moorellales bacterium]
MAHSLAVTRILPPQLDTLRRWAEAEPERFWDWAAREVCSDLHWFRYWDQALVWEYPSFRWFVGGHTNISYNCLDHNVKKGRAGRAALVLESGETGQSTVVTYAQLLDLVRRCASALKALGVGRGDRVAVYLPMSLEAVVTMLACARIGAVHVVVFAGFSAGALAERLRLTGARYLVTGQRTFRRGKPVELADIAKEALAGDGDRVRWAVVVRHPESGAEPAGLFPPGDRRREISWEELLSLGRPQEAEAEVMEANEPLFLLPTSGTTAKPKVTVQTHGGYQVYVHLMGKWVYGLKEQDVWFCTSDIGWIVGHSYNVYGPLLAGCTSVLYDGAPDYPQPDMWWRVIERNWVTGFWVSPTGVRLLMRLGLEPARQHDLSSVERVFCAGEVLNPPAWQWLQEEVFENRVPVIDHLWQTETSGPVFANPYGLGMVPIKPGSAGIPLPGIVAEVVEEKEGRPLPPGQKGVVVIRRPFPGLTPTLWGEPDRYRQEYWEKAAGTRGSYYLGDAAYRDEEGYYWFAGRADEVIKIASHRIGTVEIESALLSHPAVAEAGVSGVPDEMRGEVASAFVVLRSGYAGTQELKQELMAHLRRSLGPIVVMRDIQFVAALPKTRSGKIMRRVMKALLTGGELGDLSTLEEDASVEEIREAVTRMQARPNEKDAAEPTTEEGGR